MKKQLFILSSLLFFSVIFSSCCTSCGGKTVKLGELESGSWQLIEFNLNPVENNEITLSFNAEEKMMYGTAPCNNFFAGYRLFNAKADERNIEFINGGSTKRLCPDSQLEEKFQMELQTIYRVKLEGNNLLMIDSLEHLKAVLVKIK